MSKRHVMIGAMKRVVNTPSGLARRKPAHPSSDANSQVVRNAAREFLESRGVGQVPDRFNDSRRLSS